MKVVASTWDLTSPPAINLLTAAIALAKLRLELRAARKEHKRLARYAYEMHGNPSLDPKATQDENQYLPLPEGASPLPSDPCWKVEVDQDVNGNDRYRRTPDEDWCEYRVESSTQRDIAIAISSRHGAALRAFDHAYKKLNLETP